MKADLIWYNYKPYGRENLIVRLRFMKIVKETEISESIIRRMDRNECLLTAMQLKDMTDSRAAEALPLLFACLDRLMARGGRKAKGSKAKPQEEAAGPKATTPRST